MNDSRGNLITASNWYDINDPEVTLSVSRQYSLKLEYFYSLSLPWGHAVA